MFQAAMLRATDRVYARAGEAATHTDRNGIHTPCTVMVERDLTRYGESAQVNTRTAVVGVRVSELASAPRRSDKFTLSADGQVLTVDSLQATDLVEHKVFVA